LKIEDAFMQRVHAIIHQNLNNPDFSVEMFCREIGMSHTQFFNKLKSLTGLSAVQLIRQVRIKEAKRMLKDKNLSVTDVAFQTGFSEAAYFSRIFSKETGMTPSEYKKSL
jgi:AraC-like DNA-binding protein